MIYKSDALWRLNRFFNATKSSLTFPNFLYTKVIISHAFRYMNAMLVFSSQPTMSTCMCIYLSLMCFIIRLWTRILNTKSQVKSITNRRMPEWCCRQVEISFPDVFLFQRKKGDNLFFFKCINAFKSLPFGNKKCLSTFVFRVFKI